MNSDLHLLRRICAVKRLAMNCEKTVYMQFSLTGSEEQHMTVRAHLPLCTDLHQCSCPELAKVDTFSYLGVTFQSNLKWDTQVNNINRTGRAFLSKLFHIRKITPKYVQKNLYTALFQSRMTYGLVVWGGTFKTTLKPIIVTQKFIIRTMENESRMCPSRPLFQRLGVMPLQYLFVYVTTRCFFQRSGQLTQQGVRPYVLRNPGRFAVPRPRTEHFKKTAHYLGPVILNCLPGDITDCSKKELFLIKIKRYLWSQEGDVLLELVKNV